MDNGSKGLSGSGQLYFAGPNTGAPSTYTLGPTQSTWELHGLPGHATFLTIPIVGPPDHQPVGDELTMTVYRPDGTLVYAIKGFVTGGFSLIRGEGSVVHRVTGSCDLTGPRGGEVDVILASTARQGAAGQDFTTLGIVQVSAEDPNNWTVAGSTVGTLHQFIGPLAGVSVPVVIKWQIRDLV